jgi:hypothetical protein
LAEYADQIDGLYGTKRVAGWASYLSALKDVNDHLGESLPFPELLGAIEQAVAGQINP